MAASLLMASSFFVGRVRRLSKAGASQLLRVPAIAPIHPSAWRDCLETPNGLRFVVPRSCGTGRKGIPFGASHYQETCDPTRPATFQTVSGRGVPRSSL